MADPTPWTARVLTLHPEVFPGPLGVGVLGRALAAGLWRLETVAIRDFATDRHRSVDDTPAGGGAGMVLRADVLASALDHAVALARPARPPVIALSARGRPFRQAEARRLAAGPGMILIAGRFEGIDQRILDARAVEEVSIGDFVLSGGEIPAMALIDATVRLIGGVLGNAESSREESFSGGLLEFPQYTRPTLWEGRAIPEVLLSGHHGRIAAWRLAEAERVTRERRPDLWRAYRGARPDHGTEDRPERSDAERTAGNGDGIKDDRR